ncbi:MAG: FKBP-type peptidyl-prolyl cis-trans isomerase [Nocardioidaceae bacterium]
MRRRLVALTVVPLLLFGAAACGGGDDSAGNDQSGATNSPEGEGGVVEGVDVSGEVGQEPKVTVDSPLTLDETQSEVITEGDGDEVVSGKQASLHIYLANGTTGKKAAATYGSAPQVFPMVEGQIWRAVLDAIVGQPTGSRVVVAATPEDAFGPQGAQQYGIGAKDNVVFVVDVMGVEPSEVLDGPEGEDVNPPKDLPSIKADDSGGVEKLTFENAPKKPSKDLQVIPLVNGEGDPVEKGDLVTFDYLGQVYGSEKVFDQSYTDKPRTFSVGVGGLIKAWDEGLVGVKEGSRVMIIAPPEYGYGAQGSPPNIPGNASLVFVVDILGVS